MITSSKPLNLRKLLRIVEEADGLGTRTRPLGKDPPDLVGLLHQYYGGERPIHAFLRVKEDLGGESREWAEILDKAAKLEGSPLQRKHYFIEYLLVKIERREQ